MEEKAIIRLRILSLCYSLNLGAVYDVATNQWGTPFATPMTFTQAHAAGFDNLPGSSGPAVVVFSFRDPSSGADLTEVWKYSPADATSWVQIGPLGRTTLTRRTSAAVLLG